MSVSVSCVSRMRPAGHSSVALVVVLATWLLLGAVPAFAAAEPHPKVGEFGPLTNPNGIAVDESTGDVYVATLGADEQQTVTLGGEPAGGGFALEFEGQKTSVLAVAPGEPAQAPSAGEVEAALAGLSNVGAGAVSVSQSGELPGTVTYTVTFQGPLGSRSVAPLACDGSALTGGTGTSCAITTSTAGLEGQVHKFDSEGKPVEFAALHSATLTGAPTPAKTFSFPNVYGTPAAAAVDNSRSPLDPSAGDLYVMDAGDGVIDKFSPTGDYLGQIRGFAPATGTAEHELLGLAVDAEGHVRADVSNLETAHSIGVDEFDNSDPNRLIVKLRLNEEANSLGVPKQNHQDADGYTVAPTGDNLLLYRSCSCTVKLGQQLAALGRVDENAGDVALATDPRSGHLYVDDQSTLTEWDTGAMNGSKAISVTESEAAGVQVGESFGSLAGSSGQGGIAVNGVTGAIYASSPGAGEVLVFSSEPPAANAGGASDVTKTTAGLNGTVDPRGSAVSECRFDYGVADEYGRGEYEHHVACEQTPAEIGAGSDPVAVSATIEGLKPGLLYRFRLVAAGAHGSGESSGLVATARVGFGIKHFDVLFLNQDGTPDTQAGSHPFKMVNDIEFNSHFQRREANADSVYVREPDGTVKDLALNLPAGVVGDPNATLNKCTPAELATEESGVLGCPPESLVGVWEIETSTLIAFGNYPGTFHERIFNMVPPRGTALQLGVKFDDPNLFINSGVLAGGDYPVQATVTNAPASAPLFASKVTVFGVAGSGSTRKPFLTLPTGCHGPLRSTISMDSYQEPGRFVSPPAEVMRNSAGTPVGLTGCSKLSFSPTVTVAPDTKDASTSSGLTVGVHVPQTAAFNPDGLAESALRDTTVTLPEGVALNPSGGDGLESCSEGLAGFTGFSEFNKEAEPGVETATFMPDALEGLSPGSSLCPDGSKIGTVKLKTPLLEHELEGAVYLASQNQNPFGSLVAMYMLIEDPISGSTVKLTGEVHLTESGQVVTTFKNTPDLPFEDLELHFFGGERAPLATPSRCGIYTTSAVFTPWDGNGPVTSESKFSINHGPHGGPCPGASLPFSPALTGGTTNINAGSFSPLVTTISRDDGQQNMSQVTLHMPPGLSGLLSGVKLCPETQANEGKCGEESLIGETTVAAGVGSDPASVRGGKVYITEKYHGAPFGLSIVNPVKAGPFDLEHDTSNPAYQSACDCIVVRARIEVDPTTAALTVTTNSEGEGYAIPRLIDGIPVQIQKVNVLINRQRFTFNPTSCDPMEITGAITGDEGASSPVSVPFQATNCASLGFAPKFAVSTTGKNSKAEGAGLSVRLTYPTAPFGSQANIRQVKVELPKQLPSRLTTLQKACTAAQFKANPAGCPAASIVGYAKAITPLIPVPLEGPAYFVSNGGEAFPNLILVLQGYGVTIDLVGDTFISKAGITSSTFKTVPDAPVGSFELVLPQGPYSALTANANLCALTRTVLVKKKVTVRIRGRKRTVTRKVKGTQPASLSMPTEFLAQNGMTIHQNTQVAVTGCPKAKAKRKARKAKRTATHRKKH
jgi:hypothetical protein